jgi:hypothetical protein
MILKVHSVSDVRQIEKLTAEPLVPLKVQITVGKLKKCKSVGSDQIPAGVKGDITVCDYTNSLILYGIRKSYLISGRGLLLYLFKKKKKKTHKTDCSNYYGLTLLSASYTNFSNIHSVYR